MTSKRSKSESPVKASLGSYRVEQRQIIRGSRVFHFVSYEGRDAKPAWFLMNEGKRWEVAPQIEGEDLVALDNRLSSWLDEHVTGSSVPPEPASPPDEAEPPRTRGIGGGALEFGAPSGPRRS